MRTLESNEFVYEDETASPPPASASSPEPRLVSDFTFEDEPSTGLDALRGAGQGVTFGFSDEALAAAKTAGDVVAGKKNARDISDIYKEYVEIERQKLKEAKERSPVLFTAGEVAGSVPLALLSGPVGAVASLGRAVKTAAAIGALSGLGASENSLVEAPGGAALDVAKGALGGVVTAGALGVGGALGRGALDLVKKTPLFEQLKIAKSLPSLAPAALARSKTAATETVAEIENAISKQGQKIEGALENAGKAGVKIFSEGSDDALSSAARNLEKDVISDPNLLGAKGVENSLLKKLLGTKQDPSTGSILEVAELTPKDANVLRRAARDKFYQLGRIENPDSATRSQMTKLRSLDEALKEKLESKVPNFKLENEAFEEFQSAVPETFLSKGAEKTIELEGGKAIRTGVASYSQKTPDELRKSVQSLIDSLKASGSSNKKYVEAYEALKQRLDDFGADRLKELGINKEEFLRKIEKEANISRIYSDLYGVEPGEGVARRLGAWASPSGQATRAAYLLGKVQRGVEKTGLPELSRRLFSLPKDALETAVARPLKNSSNPVAARYGEMLSDALSKSTPGNTATNAVLFTILQNAAARRVINEE